MIFVILVTGAEDEQHLLNWLQNLQIDPKTLAHVRIYAPQHLHRYLRNLSRMLPGKTSIRCMNMELPLAKRLKMAEYWQTFAPQYSNVPILHITTRCQRNTRKQPLHDLPFFTAGRFDCVGDINTCFLVKSAVTMLMPTEDVNNAAPRFMNERFVSHDFQNALFCV